MQNKEEAEHQYAENAVKYVELHGLTILHLARLGLRALPEGLWALRELRELHLYENGLGTVSDGIANLDQLRVLDLSWTQLVSVPEAICLLKDLSVLRLDNNNIAKLPDCLGELGQLEELCLDNNHLTSLPASFGSLFKLKTLTLSHNQLVTLPDNFNYLSNLEELHLQNNDIASIPESILSLADKSLIEFYLHENPRLGLPPEIVGPPHYVVLGRGNLSQPDEWQVAPPDPKRIARFLRQINFAPTRTLDEAKLIVVGPGGHGKSSLIEYLRDYKFQIGRDSTQGVKVSHWQVSIAEDRKVRLNVWDFGGQEIQYSTHQFFLSERAVYLLVYNARDDIAAEQGVYDWVNLIHTLAPEAPVIIALSKQDEHEGLVNGADLKVLHPKILDLIPVSCVQGHRAERNVARLEQLISQTVAEEMGHVHFRLPASWLDVKDRLENDNHDYLSYGDYQQLCTAKGIEDPEDQELLARYLNDLGTMLNYGDRMPLEDTHILKPEWVTEGVYAVILAEELKAARGRLRESLLGRLLTEHSSERYPLAAQRFIRDMMLQFSLCYELQSGNRERTYLVPNALPQEEPAFNFEKAGALRFEVRFPRLMPSSVMEQFIVAMNPQGEQDVMWRFGVSSELLGHPYLVQSHPGERKISIWIGGQGPGRPRVLEIIRQRLAGSGPRNLEIEEYTFPPGAPGDRAYKFEDLLQHERDGKREVYFPGVGDFSVREWLDGITVPEHRAELQQRREELDRMQGRGGTSYHAEKMYFGGNDMSDTNNSSVSIGGSFAGNFSNVVGDENTVTQSAEVDQRIKLLAEDPAAMRAELDKLRGLIEQAKSAGADEDDTEIAAKALTKLTAAVEAPEKPESKEEAKGALRRLKNAAEAFKEFASIGENWVTILRLVAPAAGMVLGAPGLFEGMF